MANKLLVILLPGKNSFSTKNNSLQYKGSEEAFNFSEKSEDSNKHSLKKTIPNRKNLNHTSLVKPPDVEVKLDKKSFYGAAMVDKRLVPLRLLALA
jgi:hypothetical protein